MKRCIKEYSMIKYVNDVGITQAFYEGLTHDDYDHPQGWSPSSLNAPPHQQKLLKEALSSPQILNKLSVERKIHLFLGQALHSYFEKSPYVFTEKRMFIDIDGERVSAKFDLYDPRDKSIQDFKVVGKNSAYDNDKVTVKPEYEAQLNINAYIFRQHDLPVKALYINYVFKDFMYRDRMSKNGPKHHVESVKVDMWEDSKVRDYIIGRINYHKNWSGEHCTFDERWAKQGKYALMKEGGKKAVKLYDIDQPMPTAKAGQYYEFRPGSDGRCENYCDVNSLCSYYLNSTKGASE